MGKLHKIVSGTAPAPGRPTPRFGKPLDALSSTGLAVLKDLLEFRRLQVGHGRLHLEPHTRVKLKKGPRAGIKGLAHLLNQEIIKLERDVLNPKIGWRKAVAIETELRLITRCLTMIELGVDARVSSIRDEIRTMLWQRAGLITKESPPVLTEKALESPGKLTSPQVTRDLARETYVRVRQAGLEDFAVEQLRRVDAAIDRLLAIFGLSAESKIHLFD